MRTFPKTLKTTDPATAGFFFSKIRSAIRDTVQY